MNDADQLLTMLHNMPRDPQGQLQRTPSSQDLAALGMTAEACEAARDALVAAGALEVSGEGADQSWKLLRTAPERTGYTPGYTPGFGGTPAIEPPLVEAEPKPDAPEPTRKRKSEYPLR